MREILLNRFCFFTYRWKTMFCNASVNQVTNFFFNYSNSTGRSKIINDIKKGMKKWGISCRKSIWRCGEKKTIGWGEFLTSIYTDRQKRIFYNPYVLHEIRIKRNILGYFIINKENLCLHG